MSLLIKVAQEGTGWAVWMSTQRLITFERQGDAISLAMNIHDTLKKTGIEVNEELPPKQPAPIPDPAAPKTDKAIFPYTKQWWVAQGMVKK